MYTYVPLTVIKTKLHSVFQGNKSTNSIQFLEMSIFRVPQCIGQSHPHQWVRKMYQKVRQGNFIKTNETASVA